MYRVYPHIQTIKVRYEGPNYLWGKVFHTVELLAVPLIVSPKSVPERK